VNFHGNHHCHVAGEVKDFRLSLHAAHANETIPSFMGHEAGAREPFEHRSAGGLGEAGQPRRISRTELVPGVHRKQQLLQSIERIVQGLVVLTHADPPVASWIPHDEQRMYRPRLAGKPAKSQKRSCSRGAIAASPRFERSDRKRTMQFLQRR
jgi:antitoxin (DNA-binding transcriptional repressor) of toxin-antitoxin stability system